jgi:hypothetical protein
MSEPALPLRQEFGSGESEPAAPALASLPQSLRVANENCERATALAQTLSAQLREAQDRINQLEREADGLGEQLLAQAKAIIQEVRCNADARVARAVGEADDRISRIKGDAQSEIGSLQTELAQATRAIDQLKGEAGTRVESVKMDADRRVAAAEAEAKKRIDLIRRENEDKVLRLEKRLGLLEAELAQATRAIDQVKGEAGTRIESVRKEASARLEAAQAEAKKCVDIIRRETEHKVLGLEADLRQAKNRADRAEQWLMLVRGEIEEHLIPAMREGPKPADSAARPRSLTLKPASASATTWLRRLWLGVTSVAALVDQPALTVTRRPLLEPRSTTHNGLQAPRPDHS